MIRRLRGGREGGFTLIEVMIVIAIIGVLAAIAIPNFLAHRSRGMDSSAQTSAKNFYNMALAYFADGHDGTLTPGTLPRYSPGSKITCGGSITADGTGAVSTTNLTFQHANSSNVFELDSEGNVIKQ